MSIHSQALVDERYLGKIRKGHDLAVFELRALQILNAMYVQLFVIRSFDDYSLIHNSNEIKCISQLI